MPIKSPKELPVLTVLMLFGTNRSNHADSVKLFSLYREIMFKKLAVLEASFLVLDQEKILQELHAKDSPEKKLYNPEVKQMAYVGFFFDVVYSLTEKCASVNKVFYGDKLPDGFFRQRTRFIRNNTIDSKMTALMNSLNWYTLFREIRIQHVHYGSSFLAFGYDKEPQNGSSQLIIDVFNRRENEILDKEIYNFDVRKIHEIKIGMENFLEDWCLILLRNLDSKYSLNWYGDGKPTYLADFLEGRSFRFDNHRI